MCDTILFFEPTDHKILYLIPSIFSLGNSKLFTLDGKKKISQFFSIDDLGRVLFINGRMARLEFQQMSFDAYTVHLSFKKNEK